MVQLGCSGIMVLATILLIVSAVPAGAVELSVTTVQEGMQREPLDVGKTVTYQVTLSGAKSSMLYSVKLSLGPDLEDTEISKTQSQDINLNPGSSGVLSFQVNFQSPEFRRGEFGKWLSDKNQTSAWDRAWFSVDVSSLNPFEQPAHMEDYSGRPSLIKVMEEFRNFRVEPRKGTSKDVFSYQVQVMSTISDNITLEVAPSKNGPWTDMGRREYSTPGSWQTLTWSNISLAFDFDSAAYRFTGRKQSMGEGPFWPVDVIFSNNTLAPERGLSSTAFQFGIQVNSSRPIEVGLSIFDVSSKSFVEAGRRSYQDAGRWQSLHWDAVSASADPEAAGSANHYFGFYYPGAEAPFATTREMTGKYFAGPDLVVVALNDASVAPYNGSAYTPYTYSVEVVTARPRCEVELQAAAPGSGIWESRGVATYNGANSTLIWRNATFDPSVEEVGLARYRFVWDNNVLGEFFGPNFDVNFQGTTYERVGQTDRFNYKVKLRSSYSRLPVELIYTDDGVKWTRSSLIQYYESESGEWKELVWSNQPWHQAVKYDVVRG
ncbi:MAG: hypothetical protein A4E45_01217 [Methanosaeta sp. PtaB.Bin039]|nr:MAG: hypothetical protein A4E45_01217 [Methanosaeta sp. PtaB.Bin039]OPY47389.1 MAG: hypothetical protein A4E47_00298 [Methanosaeta sp. PtaU1.Bin028]